MVRDEEETVIIMEYLRTYYRGMWRQVRAPDELQYHWEPEYDEGSLGVASAVLTETVAEMHCDEIAIEVNRRALEQRLRYMMGAVAITQSVR